MIPHWTEQREALRDWLLSQPRLLIGCDFDGTLAPVVPHADEAHLPASAKSALQRLLARQGLLLAVISGRSLADLQQRIGLTGVLYAGNHGLEMKREDGSITVPAGADAAGPALRRALEQLGAALRRIPGVWIEDKQLTASIHYRLASEASHTEIEHLVRSAVHSESHLRIRPGKRIWELRPAIDWDKGTALRWFMNQCDVSPDAAAFIGDDASDFDAFRELPDGWAFIVGDESTSMARLKVNDPPDCVALLNWMAGTRLHLVF